MTTVEDGEAWACLKGVDELCGLMIWSGLVVDGATLPLPVVRILE